MPTLSVLDLIPVRADQTTGEAIDASINLAQLADRLDYRRYWVAEHHNMPAVAATNPPVTIALLASRTQRIRVGSGGVMLPNHNPLVVAEQFALLEAAFPARIDVGVGRAPGSDPVTNYAIRQGRNDAVGEFDAAVSDLMAWMAPQGVELNLAGRSFPLKATPRAVGVPAVWLLGSSDYSARLAAKLGLPYVFAHHFAGEGTSAVLDLYRSLFRPGVIAEPRTFMTANVVVAPTDDEAVRLARPNLLSMLALRTNQPLLPQLSVEDAEQTSIDPAHQRLADAMTNSWFIGTPSRVGAQLNDLAEQFGVDEVMVHPIAGSGRDAPANRAPGREQTVRLLAVEPKPGPSPAADAISAP